MRSKLQLLAILLFMIPWRIDAQAVGGNIFLQGHWLEIGMIGNGAFGTCAAPPAGYHPSGSVGLGEVYDYGHDGWTVGSPPYMGDYTLPGTPFEGWELQVNGLRNQAFQGNTSLSCPGGYTGTGTLTGGVTTYTNAGGQAIGTWQGSAASGGLSIIQQTEIDTEASWVVVTTKFYNTTSAPIPDVYYMRSCDADNDEAWVGIDGFPTFNHILFQGDTDNRVMVTSTGHYGYGTPDYLAYTQFGLGTKDCRAVCFIYGSWPLSAATDLATLYNRTYTGADYTLGTSDNGDIAIGLVFKLGTFPPNDSAVISYSYVFGIGDSTQVQIDSAFPDPELEINGAVVPDYDTFVVPIGMDTVHLNLINATTKNWTWSEWTWSPAIGLSATTGTSVYLLSSLLGGGQTYTITGTNNGVGMEDCMHKQIVFTIIPPHFAYADSPCVGGTLHLRYYGADSATATFSWSGPGGFSSTLADPVIFPATMANAGIYTLTKTIGSSVFTYTVHVVIHPLPVLNLTSSIPLCGALADSLSLGVTPYATGETFLWSGPGGFSSTAADPVLTFDSADAGTYYLTATSQYGCENEASINVWPGIDPGFTPVIHYGCVFDTVYFSNTSTNADTYNWNFGDGTPTDVNRNTMHVYTGHSLQSVTLQCSNAHCDTTLTVPLDLRHAVIAVFSAVPDTVCLGQTITFNDASYATLAGGTWSLFGTTWRFGDGGSSGAYNTSYTYAAAGAYPVTLTAVDSIGCEDSVTHNVYVVLINITSFNDTTLCVSQPLPLTNVITAIPDIGLDYSYNWSPATDLSAGNVQIPDFNGLGLFSYTLTATVMPYGCAATDVITINSVAGKPLADVTPTTTITEGSSLTLNADSEVLYWWKPNDGSLSNPNINDPVASPSSTTLYTVYGYDVNGCLDSAFVEIIVDSSTDDGIPEAFTPNNDGKNDVFKPVGMRYQHLVAFQVFNRWGQELYSSTNASSGWDGTFNGVPQDVGVYFYTITVADPGDDGTNHVYKGQVTLIR